MTAPSWLARPEPRLAWGCTERPPACSGARSRSTRTACRFRCGSSTIWSTHMPSATPRQLAHGCSPSRRASPAVSACFQDACWGSASRCLPARISAMWKAHCHWARDDCSRCSSRSAQPAAVAAAPVSRTSPSSPPSTTRLESPATTRGARSGPTSATPSSPAIRPLLASCLPPASPDHSRSSVTSSRCRVATSQMSGNGCWRRSPPGRRGTATRPVAQIRPHGAVPQDQGLRRLSPVTVIEEARQNLWRFAGNLQRAAVVVEEWRGLEPQSGLALDRAGEIAFLNRNFHDAATLFARAAIAGASVPRPKARQLLVANRWLKEGAALKLAGDRPNARRELLSATRLAAVLTEGDYTGQAQGFFSQYPIDLAAQSATDSLHRHALQVSYNARAQAGDVELRAHNYPAAAAWYDAALALVPEIGPANPEVLGYHPEVAESNLALTRIELNDARGGLESAQ